MSRQQSFEKYYAEQHDLPAETMVQYRWAEQDGYRLPGIAAAYRNYCAGWDAANFERTAHVKITMKPIPIEQIREQIAKLTDPMTVQGPRYE